MNSFNLQTFPFWLHTGIELPASLKFFLNPSNQLFGHPIHGEIRYPAAEAIIRQYAVLLFVSVLISLIFAFRVVDDTSRRVAAALFLYHVAPAVRAASRIWVGDQNWINKDLGGPWVHLVVHILCLAALGRLALYRPRVREILMKEGVLKKEA
jgi:hypothetical protein